MKVKVKLNNRNINYIKEQMKEALVETADATKSDLVQSQTMPFGKSEYDANGKLTYEGGNLQNKSTFIDDSKKSKGKVRIVNDTPYARKLYYHPEYKFNKEQNNDARAFWFEPYITGNKKWFVKNTFRRKLGEKLK